MSAKLFSTLALGLFIATGAFAGEGATAASKKKAKAPAKVAGTAQPRKAAPAATPRKAAAGAKATKVSVAGSEQWQATRNLALASGAALVVEQGGGEPLFQKNADVVVPIASITKLMTAMVVLDAMPALHETIAITNEDVDTLRGSRSRLRVGAELTREDALLVALMSSENRASHALGRHYPGGLPAFVAAMNRKATELGMYHTRFEEPTGLSSNNVSTAQDLARMVAAAHRYPLIREFSTTPEATITVSGRPLAYNNTNQLVKSTSWDIGLSKTGFIHEAGKCLVMQAWVADKPVVIVLLDSAGRLTRIGDANRIKRWMESTQALVGRKDRSA
ncbi:MAG: D-alanyl-D-alanine endopeptidase [Rhodocyclaceae bacterium]|nr:D-alanyl-D-alanine endopeptidase [Rhodocyclaceae bacterium]